jgi:AcrR family transcriptional regulator
MSYVAERREEEKERRRGEILDAGESLYAQQGWESVTIEQVARTARLSRALVYIYFRDKDDLLFGIGERGMKILYQRFAAALETPGSGRDKVDAIGRAYMGFALEFRHFFNFCSRFQSHQVSAAPTPNEEACHQVGEGLMDLVVQAIQIGVADGSISPALAREPRLLGLSLWAFTHGIVQITIAKADDLAQQGVAAPVFTNYAFELVRTLLRSAPV